MITLIIVWAAAALIGVAVLAGAIRHGEQQARAERARRQAFR